MKAFLFSLLIGLIIRASMQDAPQHAPLVNLTNQSFDVEINKNPQAKWLIVFHVHECSFCTKTLKTIKEEVALEFASDKKVCFGFVDCDAHVWLATRFNITMVPYTILIQNGKMTEMKQSPMKESLIEFINESASEDMKPLPKPVSYFNMLSTLITELFHIVKENMQSQFEKHNITFIKWNHYMTGILLFLGFLLILLIESLVFKLFCGGKLKKSNAKAAKVPVKTFKESDASQEKENLSKTVEEHPKKD